MTERCAECDCEDGVCNWIAPPDPELERILAMSDDEILAEVIAAGDDPEEIARECRAIFERALAQVASDAEQVKESDK
jgi:hypothetical protein